MSVEIKFDQAAMDRLSDIPAQLQLKAFDRAMTQAANHILVRARQLAPRGNKQDADKRSKAQRQEWQGRTPLHKTLTKVYRKHAIGGIVVIGPKWPEGNVAHFDYVRKVYGVGRKKVLWGRRTGEVVKKTNHFLKQAFDQGKQQALDTFASVIEEYFRNG